MGELTRIMPSKPIARPRCPFYGFAPGSLIETNGNQCALKEGHCPCHMEMAKQAPDLYQCSHNTSRLQAQLADQGENTQIFPREFRPAGQRKWDGITLTQFHEYVLSPDTPRPE